MIPTDIDAEHAILTTPDGLALLAEVSAVAEPSPSQMTRWRKNATVQSVAAALRIAKGRRRGATKFEHAERMWLDPVGVEQATAEAVATHKAARFAGQHVVDLCSGIGGDALAIARADCRMVAVDLDQGVARRLRWNAEGAGLEDRLLPVRGRAESFGIPHDALVHIDPDRRASLNRRARSVADYAPGLKTLLRISQNTRGGAIKLGPGSDFDAHFHNQRHEIELISLDGECREATVWFGALTSCRRRATMLPEGVTWTNRDGPDVQSAPSRRPGRFVAAVDPALSRAGLTPGFAVVNGLAQLAQQGNLLTSEILVRHPFLVWFEVAADIPFDRRILKAHVADNGLGPLEIKVFGARVSPEVLRSELRPPGPNPATLIVYPDGKNVRALVTRRYEEAVG